MTRTSILLSVKNFNIAYSASSVSNTCAIGTEKADEAVVLEGTVQEVTDRAVWKQLVAIYNRKYGGDVAPLLESSGGSVFRVTPQTVFGQDEHAQNFTEAVTRWTFEKP